MNPDLASRIVGLEKDVKYTRKSVDKFFEAIEDIKKHFVRKEEFEPVKKIVFGAAKIALSMIMTGMVLGAAYILVIDKFI